VIVGVTVFVGVPVGVTVFVGVLVDVCVGVIVLVGVFVRVSVVVGVLVNVCVGVAVLVGVLVVVGVCVGVGHTMSPFKAKLHSSQLSKTLYESKINILFGTALEITVQALNPSSVVSKNVF
jgi:Na+/H+ antiporter NhaA